MNRAKLSRLLLLASILYVIGFYFIGSAIKPGYSQISNFVSEYNATGTPWAQTLTYAGFAATSAILVAFLVTASPLLEVSGASRLGAWLLWSVPASYFLAVIAPCDAGCPLDGSTNQIAHNLLAIVTYFGMGAMHLPNFAGLGIRQLQAAPRLPAYDWHRLSSSVLPHGPARASLVGRLAAASTRRRNGYIFGTSCLDTRTDRPQCTAGCGLTNKIGPCAATI